MKEYPILTGVSAKYQLNGQGAVREPPTSRLEKQWEQPDDARNACNEESLVVVPVLSGQQTEEAISTNLHLIWGARRQSRRVRCTRLSGTNTSITAFSCTCQPNMKLLNPHAAIAWRKAL
jgi:hypothetical protein